MAGQRHTREQSGLWQCQTERRAGRWPGAPSGLYPARGQSALSIDKAEPPVSCRPYVCITRAKKHSKMKFYGVTYLLKPVDPPVNDGVRSLAIIHDGIVQGSTWEPWRGPDGCGIRVHDGNAAPDPVSKSQRKHVSDLLALRVL